VLIDNTGSVRKVDTRQRTSQSILSVRAMASAWEVFAIGAELLAVGVGAAKSTRIILACRFVVGTQYSVSGVRATKDARVLNALREIDGTVITSV